MSNVVLGRSIPQVTPPAVDAGWDGLVVTWTGPGGQSFNLTNPEGGVFLVRGGMRGLGRPKKRVYRDQSPALHGATWRGMLYEPREVFWPVYLFHDGSTREWVEFDRAFFDSLSDTEEGVLEVTVPGVSTRRLRLRFEDDGNWAPEMDPTFFGWASYGLTLQADQPLWEGTARTARWEAEGAGVDFHGGTTPGDPIINLGSNRQLSAAQVTNNGDVESWAVWEILGPIEEGGVVISMDGHEIEVPVALATGERIVIDTAPDRQTAFLYDVDDVATDIFTQLGDYDPIAIPPRQTSTLDLTIDGSGEIRVSFPQLYLRAW